MHAPITLCPKLETSLYRTVWSVYRYPEPFRCDRQRDGRTDILRANAAQRLRFIALRCQKLSKIQV